MQIIERLISELEKLPGIGRKSAVRLAFYLLSAPKDYIEDLSDVIRQVPNNIKECPVCHNFTDIASEVCDICKNKNRNREKIVVVAAVQDLMAIEEAGYYNGLYHVLHGLIAPLKGIGIEDIRIDSLLKRVKENSEVKEIILALTPNMDGETTSVYLKDILKEADENIKITQIAKGIPVGSEIEYVDKMTLIKAMENRN